MDVTALVDYLLASPDHRGCITAHRHLPARPAQYADLPRALHPHLGQALAARGIHRLYSHQAEAIEHTLSGRHVAVVTPTASGKTLCYNLPVLDAVLRDPAARALYLFPTKALAQDQLAELYGLVEATGADVKTFTYDGDTSASARRAVRVAGHIVVTNPDMLHTGILPHHTKWVKLFENLRYVVVDELHQYRGVFGSHLANVLRRLRRLCQWYGSNPRFICCSATIANPAELAEQIIHEQVVLVDRSGAPSGEKHVLFYNPPVVNWQLGIRQSSLLASRRLASLLLRERLQTIVFARSRLVVEVLLSYLREAMQQDKRPADLVRGYRGGYLPLERREIERGLRSGAIQGVVATNALELGIDIGGLEAAVLCGYPGSIASAWQQMGRVGRRDGASLAILVATSSPLDQFIVTHPDYFFSRSPESGLVNPDNAVILANHVKCAAFELPFASGDTFGGAAATGAVLEHLAQEGVLHPSGGRWHWSSESFPAEAISLRSASIDNFVIVDQTDGARVIGEMDRISVPNLLHEEAIYLHGGVQYQVERLDWEQKKAYVRRVDVDYYTDANLAVDLKVLDVFDAAPGGDTPGAHGEVAVSYLATIFKKIKFDTHENLGWGKIHLPEESFHSHGFWLALPERLTAPLGREALQSGLRGLANLLLGVAPLFLMCDPRDLGVVQEIRAPFTGLPTVFLYEKIPAGVGFSERLFALRRELYQAALDLARDCACQSGCPSCAGPLNEVGPLGKEAAQRLLAGLVQRVG